MQNKFSVVLITFNEEKNIKKCLDSIVYLTDDIVIVDSFSTDKTKQICKQYKNVNFIETEWKGYSQTKNFANQHVKHDYILSLDADEVVSEELRNSIKAIDKLLGVFEFNRLTNYCGKWIKHCGWYPDKKIRIFPKEGVYWEGEHVHETLFVPNTLTTTFLEGDLHHYSYHKIEDHYKQIENYSTLHAQKMKEAGKKATPFKMIFNPILKFIKTYFFQLGVLDGYSGLLIASISAKAVSMKYKKLQALNNNK